MASLLSSLKDYSGTLFFENRKPTLIAIDGESVLSVLSRKQVRNIIAFKNGAWSISIPVNVSDFTAVSYNTNTFEDFITVSRTVLHTVHSLLSLEGRVHLWV